ncbi:putative Leucine Rich repeat [Trypanosoma vivax]|nr:putative Leucine Rich repeat [Trypanosoma vivax]
MLFTGVLPLYSFLRVIQLHHCAIGDNGILVIVEFIRGYRPPADKNPFGIQCVEFPGCQIGPVGAKHISTLLTENESIGRCILDFNPLGDAGVKVIASAVRWNGTLEELSLQHCGIESPGAEAIAEGVLSCSNVRSLSLRGNALGPGNQACRGCVECQ